MAASRVVDDDDERLVGSLAAAATVDGCVAFDARDVDEQPLLRVDGRAQRSRFRHATASRRSPTEMMTTAAAAPIADYPALARLQAVKPRFHGFAPVMRKRPSVPVSSWLVVSSSTSKRRVSSSSRENVIERDDARHDELQIHRAIAVAQRIDAHLADRAPPRSPRACSGNPPSPCRRPGAETLANFALTTRGARVADDALARGRDDVVERRVGAAQPPILGAHAARGSARCSRPRARPRRATVCIIANQFDLGAYSPCSKFVPGRCASVAARYGKTPSLSILTSALANRLPSERELVGEARMARRVGEDPACGAARARRPSARARAPALGRARAPRTRTARDPACARRFVHLRSEHERRRDVGYAVGLRAQRVAARCLRRASLPSHASMRSFATAATCVVPDGKLRADRKHHLLDVVGQRLLERERRDLPQPRLTRGGQARLRPSSTSTAFTSTVQRRPASAVCAECKVPLPSAPTRRPVASNAPQVAVPASDKRTKNVSAKLLDSEAAEQRPRDSAAIALQHRAHRELI